MEEERAAGAVNGGEEAERADDALPECETPGQTRDAVAEVKASGYIYAPAAAGKRPAYMMKKPTTPTSEMRKHINKASSSMLFHIAAATLFSLIVTFPFEYVLDPDSSASKFYYDLMSNGIFAMLLNSFFQLFAMTVPFIITAKMFRVKVKHLISYAKPEKGTFLPTVLMGLGGCMLANYASNFILRLFSAFGLYPTGGSVDTGTTVPELLISTVTVAIIPALFEEFAMRGIFMGLLAKKTTKTAAIILSAIAFGAFHGNFVQMPFAFIVGILLGCAYYTTGSMWAGMVIHFANNFYSVLMDWLMQGFPPILGDVVSAAVTLVLVALGIVGFMMLSKRKPDFLRFGGEKTLPTSKCVVCGITAPCFIIMAAYFLFEACMSIVI